MKTCKTISTKDSSHRKNNKEIIGPRRGESAFEKIRLKKTKSQDMSRSQLARLMRLSWEIQKSKHRNRSRSLSAAWAIFLNEDITVYYLIRKHSHNNRKDKIQPAQVVLFP